MSFVSGQPVSATDLAYFQAITVGYQAWTPTLTSLTVGSGSSTARYMQIGQLFIFEYDFVYGSGSAVGSNPSISMPSGLTLASRYADLVQPIAWGQCYDSSAPTSSFPAIATRGSSATQINFYSLNGNANPSSIGSTSPFTWATGDHLYVRGTAELA